MAIPIKYNLLSIKERWTSTLVAVLSIAGVVAVFIAVLAMAQGFRKTLVASGSPGNALVLRGGASSEMESAVTLEQVKIIGDAPGVARDDTGQPLISPEVVVIAAFPLRSTGTDANVQIRGVSEKALKVRTFVDIVDGKFFSPGLPELVVGINARDNYSGFDLGSTVSFGGRSWRVVGIMASNGSSFDSEMWCDAVVLNQTYKRPENIFQSVTVSLISPDQLEAFKNTLTSDPRLTVSAISERSYYEKQSIMVFTLIEILGFLIASVMGIGAMFGAINTMYSAVSARTREIATLRAIGFRGGTIVASFMLEAVIIAVCGGILGTIIILPIHGNMASTMNWQTFSHLSFAFMITPAIIFQGLGFAAGVGFLGGLFPAYRAARIPVATALRQL
ncbi:ABC transporter permease [bacterium]|nr:ABC transporter permease [candidate division CSSED10-310 bacterium]